MTRRSLAFTLIELLIVVAIIAILAAIAVPNFMEAQVRAKVVTVRNDFRTIVQAMEAYRVDNQDYPPDYYARDGYGSWLLDYLRFIPLTTPIAYMTQIPVNPFFDTKVVERGSYSYWRNDSTISKAHGIFYAITSVGPDTIGQMNPRGDWVGERAAEFLNALYDGTNGTKSKGDLHCSNIGVSY